MRAPEPRVMIRGVPPTERKARTGLLTPPTSTDSASWNSDSEREWERSCVMRRKKDAGWKPAVRHGHACGVHPRAGFRSALLQPARYIFRVVRANDVGAGALDSGEDFEHDALFF